MKKTLPTSTPSTRVWILLLGGTGFACGFLGPIALNPDANQGPLLGILITGPVGAVLGAVLGLAFRWTPVEAKTKWSVLVASCIVGAVTILYFCFPEPKTLGYVVDGIIANCSMPEERMSTAVAYWEDRIAAAPWAKVRAGWREETARMLRDEGAVIAVAANREASLLEHRKPWNRGKLSLSAWRAPTERQTYFARFNGSECTAYQGDVGPLYVAYGQSGSGWPPTDLQNFLNLPLIDPLPGRYRQLME